MSDEELLTVTELATQLGITPRTIRFYETKGLIAPRRIGTTRAYSHKDRARMILILRGKRLGFSLKEIKEYLDLYRMDATQIAQIRHLQTRVRERRLQLLDQKAALNETLEELDAIEAQIEEALRAKSATTDAA